MRGILPNATRTSSFDSTNQAGASGWFSLFASQTANWTGKPAAFLTALAVVVIWGITGPIFNYSDTWQLVINTGTTIITFLMVFLIQNTQNRDTLALQVKLAELIVAMQQADNQMAFIEEAPDEELRQVHDALKAKANSAAQASAGT